MMWWLLIVLHGVPMEPAVYLSETDCWAGALAFIQRPGMPSTLPLGAMSLQCVPAPKSGQPT
jgi:hypothetical protein